ncbi:unnamed protein product, partial [Urochloa humidicola]
VLRPHLEAPPVLLLPHLPSPLDPAAGATDGRHAPRGGRRWSSAPAHTRRGRGGGAPPRRGGRKPAAPPPAGKGAAAAALAGKGAAAVVAASASKGATTVSVGPSPGKRKRWVGAAAMRACICDVSTVYYSHNRQDHRSGRKGNRGQK